MDERRLRSKKQESKVAKEVCGRTTPASGALWGAKADVRNDVLLIECKTTQKDYYQLTFKVWDKIYHEAIKDGLRIPVMCIDLNDGKERIAVLRTNDLCGYPEVSPLKTARDLSGKTAYRIKYSSTGRRFCITNSKAEYDLHAIPWDIFLEEVAPCF